MEYITWNWEDQLLENVFVAGMLICERTDTTRKITSLCLQLTYEGGPKYFRNLNLPHKRDIVQGSATRYGEPTIF
jgi:hypothetical protein